MRRRFVGGGRLLAHPAARAHTVVVTGYAAAAPPEDGDTEPDPPRAYHHGNLAAALVEAAAELAVTGGPEAVVLREAARRVGVSPAAAYRHFDGQAALLLAVKNRAMEELGRRMEQASTSESPSGEQVSEAEAAAAGLAALGRAYLDFAFTESGLFRCICLGLPLARDHGDPLGPETPAFGVAFRVLGELVDRGYVPERFRTSGPVLAWSMVHGLATLTLDGPLAALPDEEKRRIFEDGVEMVMHGILSRPGS